MFLHQMFIRFSSSQLSRFYSSGSPSSKEKTTAKTPKFDGFVTVYKFPYLAPAVLFTKFKIVQTAAVTLVLAPYYVYQVNSILCSIHMFS